MQRQLLCNTELVVTRQCNEVDLCKHVMLGISFSRPGKKKEPCLLPIG